MLQHMNEHLMCDLSSHPSCSPELKARLKASQHKLCAAVSETDSGRTLLIEVILPLATKDFLEAREPWFNKVMEAAMSTYARVSELTITIEDVSELVSTYTKEGTKKGRALKSLQDLVNNDDARAAALRLDEVIAAYMYTGPMYQVRIQFLASDIRLTPV